MTELSAHNISVTAGGQTLLSDVSLSVRSGEVVAILGPNGAGKTTLLRALLGIVALSRGAATLDGGDCAALSARERARLVSYLPQRRPLAWPIKVRDVVALGRFAYGATLGQLQAADKDAVRSAISDCGLDHLIDRDADSLSGGEIARVHFARAIAAQTPLLLADEPTAALDPLHQMGITQLIRDFADSGRGTLVVLHDVALAARIADRMIWMRDGEIVASGPTTDTLTESMLADVYDVRARVRHDQHGFNIRILGDSSR